MNAIGSNSKTRKIGGLASIILLALATGLSGAYAEKDVEGATVPISSSEAELEYLAAIFSEAPSSTTNTALAQMCGTEGHCNYMACPSPECPADKSPACKCYASNRNCEDKHDWYNPFDNDEHVVMNCDCWCSGPADPKEEICISVNGNQVCVDKVLARNNVNLPTPPDAGPIW